MSVRAKLSLIIAAALASLVALVLLFHYVIVLRRAASEEERQAVAGAARVMAAVEAEVEALATMTVDWAWWDDTYAFVENANADYAAAFLSDQSMATNHFDFMVFAHGSGRIVFAGAYDHAARRKAPVPAGLLDLLRPGEPLVEHRTARHVSRGLLALPGGPVIVAAAAILDSRQGGPPRGTLVIGRLLDRQLLDRLGQATRLTVDLWTVDDPQAPADVAAVRPALTGGSGAAVREYGETAIAAYAPVLDALGRPALLLRVTEPREATRQAMDGLRTFLVAILLTGLLIGALVGFLVDRYVSTRLARLSAFVSGIGSRESLSQRVDGGGQDEIANLAAAVNRMLGAMEQDLADKEAAERDRARLEAIIARMQRLEALGALAGGIAHDFNNMLTPILGYTHLAAVDLARGVIPEARIAAIREAAQRARALTEQILSFARGQPLDQRGLDLNREVDAMESMLSHLIGRRNVIVKELADDLRPVTADPSQIQQVIANLVINARDAMPDGGRITIRTANFEVTPEFANRAPRLRPGPHVRLTVCDTGTGMTPEVQQRIFEPLFTTKEPGKGTGLGLATVYSVVTKHRGHIEVASAPGDGTTFGIYFPAA